MKKWFWNQVLWPEGGQRRTALFWAGVLAVFWLCFYYIGGMLSGYVVNPFSASAAVVTAGILLAREDLRALTLALLRRIPGNEMVHGVLTAILFAALTLSFGELTGLHTALEWCQAIVGTVLPALALSAFLTALAAMGGMLPGILYGILTSVLPLFVPVAPISYHLTEMLLGIVLPLIFLIVLDNDEEEKNDTAPDEETAVDSTKKKGLAAVPWMFSGIALLLVVCLFFGVLPIRLTAIATGSMEPELNIGDMVIVAQWQRTPEEGDIIQFYRDGYWVIHRVAEVTEEDGETFYVTKGDANNAQDSGVVEKEDIVGTVVGKIPGVGWLTLWLHGN